MLALVVLFAFGCAYIQPGLDVYVERRASLNLLGHADDVETAAGVVLRFDLQTPHECEGE